MKLLAALVLSVSLLTLSSCGTSSDPAGDWGVDRKGEPSLHLAKDGKVSGSDGCNRLMTTWKQDGDQIKFDIVAGTLMHCEGVDTWLSAMNSATVKGDVMTVKDSAGKEIGKLKRSAK